MDFMKSYSFSDASFRWILYGKYLKTPCNSRSDFHWLTFKLIYTNHPTKFSILAHTPKDIVLYTCSHAKRQSSLYLLTRQKTKFSIPTHTPKVKVLYTCSHAKREKVFKTKKVLFLARTSFKLVFLWSFPFKNRL